MRKLICYVGIFILFIFPNELSSATPTHQNNFSDIHYVSNGTITLEAHIIFDNKTLPIDSNEPSFQQNLLSGLIDRLNIVAADSGVTTISKSSIPTNVRQQIVNRVKFKALTNDETNYDSFGLVINTVLPSQAKFDRTVYLTDQLWTVFNALASELLANISSRSIKISSAVGINEIRIIDYTQAPLLEMPAKLYERCSALDMCGFLQNVQCGDDLWHGKRCKCMIDHAPVGPENCYPIVSPDKDASCDACTKNEGVCVDIDNTVSCSCPNTRSGPKCETSYVNVGCTNSTGQFAINICLTPFDTNYTGDAFFQNNTMADYLDREDQFTDPRARIVFPYSKNEVPGTCRFAKVTSSGQYGNCPVGSWQGNATAESRQCGAVMFQCERGQTCGSVPVSIDFGHNNNEHNVNFEAKCRVGNVNVQTGPKEINVNEKKYTYEKKLNGATLKMDYLTKKYRYLADGAQVLKATQFFVLVELRDDDFAKPSAYEAIFIDNCHVHDGPNLTAATNTQQILQDGCPEPGQYIIAANNAFLRLGTNAKKIMTQPEGLSAFQLGTPSPTMQLHLQCTIKVCNLMADCAGVDCNGFNAFGRRRRKRAAVTENVSISRYLVVKDLKMQAYAEELIATQKEENEKTERLTIWLIIAVSGVVLITLFGLIFVLGRKYGHQKALVKQGMSFKKQVKDDNNRKIEFP